MALRRSLPLQALSGLILSTTCLPWLTHPLLSSPYLLLVLPLPTLHLGLPGPDLLPDFRERFARGRSLTMMCPARRLHPTIPRGSAPVVGQPCQGDPCRRASFMNKPAADVLVNIYTGDSNSQQQLGRSNFENSGCKTVSVARAHQLGHRFTASTRQDGKLN